MTKREIESENARLREEVKFLRERLHDALVHPVITPIVIAPYVSPVTVPYAPSPWLPSTTTVTVEPLRVTCQNGGLQ